MGGCFVVINTLVLSALRSFALCVVGLAMSQTALAQVTQQPLSIRNVSPFGQLYGLPRYFGGALVTNGYQIAFSSEVANNFTGASAGDDLVFLDGETLALSYRYRRQLFERFELGLEVPWLSHQGGIFDGFIDEFHELFGFPDGGRTSFPRSQINFTLSSNGAQPVAITSRQRGLGDIRALAGVQLWRTDQRALAARLQVKLPTGSFDRLTGSDGTDVAAYLEYSDAAVLSKLRLTLTAGAGLVYLGAGDLLPVDQRQLAASGHFGLHFRVGERIRLIAQLDGHSELVDALFDEVGGAALQGTLGGRIQLLKQRLWLDIGVEEDLIAESTSDVVFHFSLGAKL